jgi:hypothetical protein
MGRTSAGRNANSRPDHNGRNTVELLPSFAEGTVAFPLLLQKKVKKMVTVRHVVKLDL